MRFIIPKLMHRQTTNILKQSKTNNDDFQEDYIMLICSFLKIR